MKGIDLDFPLKATYSGEKMSPKVKVKRGFAAMDPEKQREIASRGGTALPNEKRSYAKNKKLAQASGRKGGKNVAPENRSFSRNKELAREAGRKGGTNSGYNRSQAKTKK